MSSDGKNSESPNIERVFGLLDRWRHFPTYQLERRADVFFALFLPEVLGKRFGIKINPLLVPEFPIKQPHGFRSNRVDYFAYSSKGAHSFLIELKTDMSSVRSSKGKEQLKRLKETAQKDLKELVRDIIAISERSADKQKYVHLLRCLQELGLVTGIDEDLYKRVFPKVIAGVVKEGLAKVKVTDAAKRCPKPEVVYIIPEGPRDAKTKGLMRGVHQILFEEFVKYAKNRGTIGSQFAKSLECWTKQAGSCPPQP